MYDLIIVGAGPAGITAAIYAARKKMDFLVITKDVGGQTALSSDVENYTGYQYVTGIELTRKFGEHMREFNIDLREFEEVVGIEKIDDKIRIKTNKDIHETKTVIIASGAKPRTLNVPGEVEFKNRGVTYCATCDAPLFADMDVAVIGGGNSALDATLQLTNIASKIYLINKNPVFQGDEVMLEKVKESSKVTILYNTRTVEIIGDKMVKDIRVETDGEEQVLKVQGVFIEIGYVPNSEIASNLVKRNERREIIVDSHNRTNVLGVFAAGDVTDVPQKQIIIAAGEGAKACLSAFEYLSKLKTN